MLPHLMSFVTHPARVFVTLRGQGCVCLSYCTQPGMVLTNRPTPALPSHALAAGFGFGKDSVQSQEVK